MKGDVRTDQASGTRELPDPQRADFHFDRVEDAPDPPAWSALETADGLYARIARLHSLVKLLSNHGNDYPLMEPITVGEVLERETAGLIMLVKRAQALLPTEPGGAR